MGAQDAHRGAQKTACCMCLEISDALSQRRRRHIDHFVTGDETWVSHITPESKQQSLHWKHTGSPKRKKFKQTISTRKIMCTVFWDRQGVLLVEFLSQSTTINSAVYCETPKKLRHAIQNKSAECWVPPFFYFTITLGRTLLLRLKTSSPHLGGKKWTTPRKPWFGAKWFSPLPT